LIKQKNFIIKSSISYASLHISNKSVVNNREEALNHIETLLKTINKEFFLEKYLSGHEYTVLIAGDESNGLEIFPVLERIFHSNLKSTEKLLTFENSRSGYQFNGYTIPEDNPYYSIPIISQEQIQRIARNAYLALNGNGYARIDLKN
jgi:D-alanine-D-alanine ligase-like ATP-grasp enzyme